MSMMGNKFFDIEFFKFELLRSFIFHIYDFQAENQRKNYAKVHQVVVIS